MRRVANLVLEYRNAVQNWQRACEHEDEARQAMSAAERLTRDTYEEMQRVADRLLEVAASTEEEGNDG